jgi:hypothetical protein
VGAHKSREKLTTRRETAGVATDRIVASPPAQAQKPGVLDAEDLEIRRHRRSQGTTPAGAEAR